MRRLLRKSVKPRFPFIESLRVIAPMAIVASTVFIVDSRLARTRGTKLPFTCVSDSRAALARRVPSCSP